MTRHAFLNSHDAESTIRGKRRRYRACNNADRPSRALGPKHFAVAEKHLKIDKWPSSDLDRRLNYPSALGNGHAMEPEDLLLAAAAILEEHDWTSCPYALDKNGRAVPYFSKHAVAFPAYDALCLAAFRICGRMSETTPAVKRALNHFKAVAGFDLNDMNGQPRCTKVYAVRALRLAAGHAIFKIEG